MNAQLFLLVPALMLSFFKPAIASKWPVVFESGPATSPQIAFTFDDGPKPDSILPILDILDLYQVKASFFVVGKMVEAHPDLILRMAATGHELCNHSYSHPNLTTLSEADVAQELRSTNAAIRKITKRQPQFFRPPGGNYNDAVIRTAESLGLATALWNINARDFAYQAPLRDLGAPPRGSFNRYSGDEIYQWVTKKARNGAIVLFHAGGVETQAALPKLIVELKARGFRFVTVSELMVGPGQNILPASY